MPKILGIFPSSSPRILWDKETFTITIKFFRPIFYGSFYALLSTSSSTSVQWKLDETDPKLTGCDDNENEAMQGGTRGDILRYESFLARLLT
jgi:hypothetical protein